MNLTPARLTVVAVFLLTLPASAVLADAAKEDAAKEDAVKPVLARIALLERTRKIERSSWRPFVRHESSTVRAAAIRGLGRTQDSRATQFIKAAMGDADMGVRFEAVFAYGQLPKGPFKALSERLEVEKDARIREGIVEAMGKRASPADVAELVALADGKAPALAGRALIGLGLLARREKGALPIISGDRISTWLGHQDRRVRYGAAYLLLRAKKLVDETSFAAAAKAAGDADPEIRALALRASDRFTQGGAVRKTAFGDRDWRVRVEAIRAAAKNKEADLIAGALDGWVTAFNEGLMPPSTDELHPILTAAKAALRLPANEATTAVAKRLRSASRLGKTLIADPELGAIALGKSHLNCVASALLDRAAGKVTHTRRCGASDYPQGFRDEWMVKASASFQDEKRFDFLYALYQKSDSLGRMAVLNALPDIKGEPDAGDLLLLGLTDPDSGVAGTAADLAPELRPPGVEDALIAAYNAMYPAREYEAVQSVFAALGKLKAKRAIPILERHTTDPQAAVQSAANDALEQLATMEKRMGRREMVPPPAEFFERNAVDVRLAEPSKVTRMTLHTTKGVINIDLFERDARETVKNFARLAGRKYFDGLSFHRVVPGFVVQGGDPKGSGWGGPGHSVLCEINAHRYERGAVGMALAGKDTGGSQFFITHAAHPHLDGTYTVFGKVTDGMPVVDALTIGDRILRVELHRER